MNGQSALILDIGLRGAFVEHFGDVRPGYSFTLSFRWQGDEIEIEGEVVHTNQVRASSAESGAVSHSGVTFVAMDKVTKARLEDMIATFVGKILAAQRVNAEAIEPEFVLSQLGQARRSRSRGLVQYTWNDGKWTQTRTTSVDQPLDGFTVAAHEDPDEIALLCSTYEQANVEGRRLIRLVAELSAATAKM